MSKYSNEEPHVHKDGAGITTLTFEIIGGERVQVSIPSSVHTRLFDKLRVTMPGYEEETGEVISFDQAS